MSPSGQAGIAYSWRHRSPYDPRSTQRHDRHNAMIKALIALVVLGVAGFAGWTWLTLHWSFAQGERAGYVQKLSRRGWICKTWEGELAMVSYGIGLSRKRFSEAQFKVFEQALDTLIADGTVSVILRRHQLQAAY